MVFSVGTTELTDLYVLDSVTVWGDDKKENN